MKTITKISIGAGVAILGYAAAKVKPKKQLPWILAGGGAIIGGILLEVIPAGSSGTLIGNSSQPVDLAMLKSPDAVKRVLDDIKKVYGKSIAENVERVMRLETQFPGYGSSWPTVASGQYERTGSAGMIAFSDSYPYGWGNLQYFWDHNPAMKPLGPVNYISWKYLAFPGMAGFWALAEVLSQRNNNPGSWNSTIPAEQTAYNQIIYSISPKFV